MSLEEVKVEKVYKIKELESGEYLVTGRVPLNTQFGPSFVIIAIQVSSKKVIKFYSNKLIYNYIVTKSPPEFILEVLKDGSVKIDGFVQIGLARNNELRERLGIGELCKIEDAEDE